MDYALTPILIYQQASVAYGLPYHTVKVHVVASRRANSHQLMI